MLLAGFIDQTANRTTGGVVHAGNTTRSDRYVLGRQGVCQTDENKNGGQHHHCKSFHKLPPSGSGEQRRMVGGLT